MTSLSQPFASFWMGGYEAASHINRAGVRLDLAYLTQHDMQVDHDYALLHQFGIRTVRESLRWHLIERNGEFDFSSVEPFIEAANRHGIQIIWTFCHYGWPNDLDLFAPEFVSRFARFCTAATSMIARRSHQRPIYTPINEISFLSWAAGQVGYIYPHARQRGSELKRQLVRAALSACDAIWQVDPDASIVHIDPVVRLVAPRNQPGFMGLAAREHESQYEAWDMLIGKRNPELGGAPCYLPIMGLNYYCANQWETPGGQRLLWTDTERDPRWRPLHKLLAEVYERYQRPIFIAETSHYGVGRAAWLREVVGEVAQARANGIPVHGMCLYPIIDRPSWDNLQHWHHSGLWELIPDASGQLQRVLDADYAACLNAIVQQQLCASGT